MPEESSFVIIVMLCVVILQLTKVIFLLDRIKDKFDHHNKVTVDMSRQLNDTLVRDFSLGVDEGYSGWQPWDIDSFKEGKDDGCSTGETGES
jgi:hypothetical protein